MAKESVLKVITKLKVKYSMKTFRRLSANLHIRFLPFTKCLNFLSGSNSIKYPLIRQ